MLMYLNEKQKQALERAYTSDETALILTYLEERKSDYNPWIASDGGWLNQTDNKGVPIAGEAKNRLLFNASNPEVKITSNVRLDAVDRIKLIVDNSLDLEELPEVMGFLYDTYKDYEAQKQKLLSLLNTVAEREGKTSEEVLESLKG